MLINSLQRVFQTIVIYDVLHAGYTDTVSFMQLRLTKFQARIFKGKNRNTIFETRSEIFLAIMKLR